MPRHRPGDRVNAGDIRPLMAVATEATQSQVVESCSTAMLRGDDVIDRKAIERIVILVELAILTTITGTLTNLSPQGVVNQGAPCS